jgi:hypothetical protein
LVQVLGQAARTKAEKKQLGMMKNALRRMNHDNDRNDPFISGLREKDLIQTVEAFLPFTLHSKAQLGVTEEFVI